MRRALLAFIVLATAGCVAPTVDHPIAHPGYAAILVWPDPPALEVDVVHSPGYGPSGHALDRLRETLQMYTAKAAIDIGPPRPVDPGDASPGRVWTMDELEAIHERTSGHAWTSKEGGVAFLQVLFLNGQLELDAGVRAAGVQVDPFIAVFPESSRTSLFYVWLSEGAVGPPNIAAEAAEGAIVVHELGHAMGLIGVGAPVLDEARVTTADEDPCACHSRNPDSVMAPGIEKVNPVRFIEERRWLRDTYDAADEAELAALLAAYPSP